MEHAPHAQPRHTMGDAYKREITRSRCARREEEEEEETGAASKNERAPTSWLAAFLWAVWWQGKARHEEGAARGLSA